MTCIFLFYSQNHLVIPCTSCVKLLIKKTCSLTFIDFTEYLVYHVNAEWLP